MKLEDGQLIAAQGTLCNDVSRISSATTSCIMLPGTDPHCQDRACYHLSAVFRPKLFGHETYRPLQFPSQPFNLSLLLRRQSLGRFPLLMQIRQLFAQIHHLRPIIVDPFSHCLKQSLFGVCGPIGSGMNTVRLRGGGWGRARHA